jgi:hypothetical protein
VVTRGSRGAVFLLTDYGEADEFAGVTRAVVIRLAPGAPVVDLTHSIPPFDVRAGARALSRSVVHLGPGVVVAVVDPGVGSGRRAVAVAVAVARDSAAAGRADAGPLYLVGPDNGLLGGAMDALGGPTAAVALPPAAAPAAAPAATPAAAVAAPEPVTGPESGRSFDGRDLFAPVAARLWLGASLNDVGMPIDPRSLVRLAPPRLAVGGGWIEAEVLWVDRFGNVQLAARAGEWAEAGLGGTVVIAGGDSSPVGRRVARRVGSFSELDGDEVGLLVDANGQLSLVCNRRAAATVLAVRTGDSVRLGSTPA